MNNLRIVSHSSALESFNSEILAREYSIMGRSGVCKLSTDSMCPDEGPFTSAFNDTWYDFKDLALPQVYPAATELFQQDSAAREVFLIEHMINQMHSRK